MSDERAMTVERGKAPWLPPRWFVRTAWVVHRAIYRFTAGRRGLWLPKSGKWGAMRLTTIGRHSGKERNAILGYYEEGPNLVTLAMRHGVTAGDLRDGIYTHPSSTEAFNEVLAATRSY